MKLMIVEDDSFMIQLYHNLFKLEGFEVELAKDGLEALDKLKTAEKMPDIILLDIMMPRMDGFEFLRQRNKVDKLKNIPVVVLSNLFSEEDQEKIKKLGAKGFITKSEQDPKELVKKVKEYLPKS